jgi:alkane 1-monooxygenase
MKALRYSGPFLFLVSIPPLYAVSEAAPLLSPLALLVTLLVTEQLSFLLGEGKPSSAFRWLPILYIPLQLAVTLWAAREAAISSPLAFATLASSLGICTGVFGMLAAHEMVHSRTRWHRVLGTTMLTGMSYRHFRIAHVHNHHRFAATDRDASTARMGEGFYAFLVRTVPAQVAEAWRFERRRCSHQPSAMLHNRVGHDILIMSAAYAALLALWGWRAAAFFAAQSILAIMVLELFNYVAHYGMRRGRFGGAHEPLSDRHSWNSPGTGNLLLFNMGHHSHHHRAASAGYERLRAAVDAPTLPGGYAASIVLALVPPLWRAVMDKRVRALGARAQEMRYVDRSGSLAVSP